MATLRYYFLKKINLERLGIINCNLEEPIYKYCIINNIDNLGDFLEFYKKERNNLSQEFNLNYFDGFVDFISLIFFKEDIDGYLLENNILDNMSLIKLGFNDLEINELINYSLLFCENFEIISVIKKYLENYKFEKLNLDSEFLITKLYVLSEYYDTKINLSNEDFDVAEKDIIKLKELYKKHDEVIKEIIKISCDFEEKVDKLPQNNKKVKKLIKDYKSFVCN